MVQTETKGIFRGDASANWIDDVGDNYPTSDLSDTGKYRLSGANSGKTELITRSGSTGNNSITDTEHKYGNGRAIIHYDVDDNNLNNSEHFWRFGGNWINYSYAYENGKFYISESGYYRITANIRAINVTDASNGSVNFINHNVSFGFYISRSSLSNNPTINPDYAAGLHKYWDEGIPGSFGLIHLNGDDRGRCGSTTFSNIYYIDEDAASLDDGTAIGESSVLEHYIQVKGRTTIMK